MIEPLWNWNSALQIVHFNALCRVWLNHYGIETSLVLVIKHISVARVWLNHYGIETSLQYALSLASSISVWLNHYGIETQDILSKVSLFYYEVWLNHYGIETIIRCYEYLVTRWVWLNHYGIETKWYIIGILSVNSFRYDWTIMELKLCSYCLSVIFCYSGMIEPLWNWNIIHSISRLSKSNTVWLNHYGIETYIYVSIIYDTIHRYDWTIMELKLMIMHYMIIYHYIGMIEPLWNWNLYAKMILI